MSSLNDPRMRDANHSALHCLYTAQRMSVPNGAVSDWRFEPTDLLSAVSRAVDNVLGSVCLSVCARL